MTSSSLVIVEKKRICRVTNNSHLHLTSDTMTLEKKIYTYMYKIKTTKSCSNKTCKKHYIPYDPLPLAWEVIGLTSQASHKAL